MAWDGEGLPLTESAEGITHKVFMTISWRHHAQRACAPGSATCSCSISRFQAPSVVENEEEGYTPDPKPSSSCRQVTTWGQSVALVGSESHLQRCALYDSPYKL